MVLRQTPRRPLNRQSSRNVLLPVSSSSLPGAHPYSKSNGRLSLFLTWLPQILTMIATIYTVVSSGKERSRLSRELKNQKAQGSSITKSARNAHQIGQELMRDNERKTKLIDVLMMETEKLSKEVKNLEEKRGIFTIEIRKFLPGAVVSAKKGNVPGDKSGAEIREKAIIAKIERLRLAIQNISRRELLDRFGKGPYKVEIMLDFPPSAGDGPDKFVIELASIDDMPHSVHTFLEQVHLGLWNGCSFFRNAPHVMQATPRSYYKNSGQNMENPFIDSGYYHVSFQEYSPNHPHKANTIGFSGRPGGPDFYINMWDNSKPHGPGGQKHYDLPTEAEPCFGTIVEGLDAVERMKNQPTNKQSFHRFKEVIGIKFAKILM